MGHDITAHLGLKPPSYLQSSASTDDLTEEFAYLRRGANNPMVRELYAALDAQSYNGGVSGGGIGRWFTREQLQKAVRRLWLAHRREPSCKPEIRFVQACLDHISTDRPLVYIAFG